MRRFNLFLVSLGVWLLGASLAEAQPSGVKGSVDALVDWDNPWSLTPDRFKEIAETLKKRKSDRAYSTRQLPEGYVTYTIGQTVAGQSENTKMNLFNGGVQVDRIIAAFENNKLFSLAFAVGCSQGFGVERKVSKKELETLKNQLSIATGDNAPKPYEGAPVKNYPPPVGQKWTHRDYQVQLIEVYNYPLSGPPAGTGIYSLRVGLLNSK